MARSGADLAGTGRRSPADNQTDIRRIVQTSEVRLPINGTDHHGAWTVRRYPPLDLCHVCLRLRCFRRDRVVVRSRVRRGHAPVWSRGPADGLETDRTAAYWVDVNRSWAIDRSGALPRSRRATIAGRAVTSPDVAWTCVGEFNTALSATIPREMRRASQMRLTECQTASGFSND
jgi:hypothetical protein